MAAQSHGQDPLRANIRPSSPKSAVDQQKTFHLPDGFEIQLFASEPDIQKPMNMAFDAQGRLWVSGSIEYPYAAEPNKGRDTIKVLQDTDGDGRADKITTFVDKLNIPIGLYPYRDGVIAYSIPNIYFFRDTDGDGRADRREVLYGPLGNPRDVHGLQNAFRRGFDGWLYVCHGFANDSTITGSDGSSISLNSGNTYRIKPDGSRVEQFTWGQVNPFGMTLTPHGEFFTADCHSKPLSLLLRGGYYPSFGKPHDGLGFVAPVMDHAHGSTAICGVAHYTGDLFPSKYHGRLFVGNVMTSRVHCDSLHWQGSTVRAKAEPDFLTTDDSWFRPVDLRIGPDGALYIADFYNRIIGHYEVPLDHPGRDRHRGRIWRVVYTGSKTTQRRGSGSMDLKRANVAQLIDALKHPNLTHRMLATDQLSDRIGTTAINELDSLARNSSHSNASVHALWALERLDRLTEEHLTIASRNPNTLTRIHAMKLLAEQSVWSPHLQALANTGLEDSEATVKRAAADALGLHQNTDAIRPLLNALRQASADDVYLRHSCRIALRNQLKAERAFDWIRTQRFTANEIHDIASISLAIQSEAAASYIVEQLSQLSSDQATVRAGITHAIGNIPIKQIEPLIEIARKNVQDDLDLQLQLLLAIQQKLRQRGMDQSDNLNTWGSTLASDLLDSAPLDSSAWMHRTLANPWGLETRKSSDDRTGTIFLSSLPGGERKTAVLRSRSFVIPKRMEFYICGHLGFPADAAKPGNFVQLRLSSTDRVVRKSLAPRNDTAQKIEWQLDELAGQEAYFEIVDGLNLSAYAWLAVSRFEPPVVSIPKLNPSVLATRLQAAAVVAQTLRLSNLKPRLQPWVASEYVDWQTRAITARAVVSFQSNSVLKSLAELIATNSVPLHFRNRICRQVVKPNPEEISALLTDTMKLVPQKVQLQLAQTMATSRTGSEALLQQIQQGNASARILQDSTALQKVIAVVPDARIRIARLTSGLPPLTAQIASLLENRRRGYTAAAASTASGKEVFAKHCALCHQLQGKGEIVGPQLDGIGNRGLARLLEDVLDPNRNVDATFHTSVFRLNDGRVLSGLFKRKEGATMIVVDQKGKEIQIQADDIEEQTTVKNSIMPDNVGTDLSPAEFYDLIAYLLSQRNATASSKESPAK